MMNLIYLSYKNLINKPLATFLSLLLLTMGVGIIAGLLVLNQGIQEKFEKNINGIDMVVGAKGSPLQLILSSVYHIDYPTGNISLAQADSLAKHPLIKWAIKLGYGDSYKGFRIVGTSHEYVEHYAAKVKNGRLWQKPYEATIGNIIAKKLDLKIGDTFSGAHGLLEGGEEHAEHPYKIVGIFEPSNSVLDQLILTNIETVWSVHHHETDNQQPDNEEVESHIHDHDHDHAHHEENPVPSSEEKPEQEITAMLIKFRNPMAMMTLPRMVNEGTSMQSAMPAIEINRLFSLMGIGADTLQMIALAIMIVSGMSVFVSLFNSLKDRQYELAIMRTLGASRLKLFLLIIGEGLLLSAVGFVFGIALSRFGLFIISESMAEKYHYDLSIWTFLPEEFYLLGITLLIGFLASCFPALRAFGMNISRTLAQG